MNNLRQANHVQFPTYQIMALVDNSLEADVFLFALSPFIAFERTISRG